MSTPASAQVLVGSSIDDAQTHAWAVYENSNEEIVLVHLPPRDGINDGTISIEPAELGEAHAVRSLNKFPDAIAGIGKRVYLVFPATYSNGHRIRRVFSGRAVMSPMGSIWGFAPSGRLDSEPVISIEGTLDALIATSDTLWTLIKNDGQYTLLTMKESGWDEVDLPSHDSDTTRWTISAVGEQLIALDLSDPNSMNPYNFDKESRSWSKLDWPTTSVPTGQYEILAGMRGLIVVDRNEQNQAWVRTWSQSGIFTITDEFEIPLGTRFTVLDSVNRLIGVSQRQNENQEPDESEKSPSTVQIYELDLSDGSLLYIGDPVASTPVSAAEMRFLMGMMMLIMVGVLVVVIMPDRADAMGIPDGFAMVDPSRRLLATLADVFLVSLMMGVIFDVRVIEIVTLSVIVRSDSAWLVIPSVMVSGVAIMSVMEWLFGASPGKFLVGIRVVRAQSGPMQRIPFWASLVRNVIKWILPPVAALALVDPESLHRGDRATQTIVAAPIGHADENEPPESKK